MRQYQLVIFDWDGTLMDSQEKIVHSLSQAVQAMSLPNLPVHTLKSVIGLGLSEAVKQLYPDLSHQQQQHFANYYRDFFSANKKMVPLLFDGVLSLLNALSDKGTMLAVATGKSRSGLDKSLQEAGLSDFFHDSRCADETFSKPHPQMLEELLDAFAVKAERAVMIGDTEYDLEMANNAGIDAIGISHGVHDEKRLQNCDPVAIFDNISDLSEYLLARTVTYQI